MRRDILPHLFLTVVSVMTVVFIWSASSNRFEWMLDDPASIKDGISYCILPVDDSLRAVESFAFLLPTFMMSLGFCVYVKRFHPFSWYSLAMFQFWLSRFFVFIENCPGSSKF